MRIAYFNANLKSGQDGVTNCVFRMIDAAVERGDECIAVTATLPVETPRIPMFRIPSVAFPLQKNYRIAVPGMHSFARYLHTFQPDIIHINSPCTLGFGAMRYGQEFGVPVVATYHTHFPTYPRYYNLTKLEELTWHISRSLYNRVDRTFVPTNPILNELAEHGIKGLQYLPNGVDGYRFNTGFRSEEWRQQFGGGTKPIILFVSRLVWEKDLRILAEAYAMLRTKRNDFELVIVGEGHARTEFEPMMPGARFLGYQSGRTLSESFASSDIFLFPSTTETFGLVTLEAMASGLAPIAARAGGAEEIIEDGISGILANPRSAPDLAAAVERLLDNPEQRIALSRNALLRAQKYEWNGILTTLFSSYENIIEQHRTKRRFHAA
ncbi:MAG: glycosyltransferase family 1 protein [Ignavibacteriales bacterium]|nr:glycosyltransferase family 1 protein [Ignavibacteriales bacterium]